MNTKIHWNSKKKKEKKKAAKEEQKISSKAADLNQTLLIVTINENDLYPPIRKQILPNGIS